MIKKKIISTKVAAFKRFTIDIPSKLHKKIKMASIKKEKTMKQIVCECLDRHI